MQASPSYYKTSKCGAGGVINCRSFNYLDHYLPYPKIQNTVCLKNKKLGSKPTQPQTAASLRCVARNHLIKAAATAASWSCAEPFDNSSSNSSLIALRGTIRQQQQQQQQPLRCAEPFHNSSSNSSIVALRGTIPQQQQE